MNTGLFDRLLVHPTPEGLRSALRDAAQVANDAASKPSFRLAWPPPDFAEFEEALATQPEGFHQWVGPGLSDKGIRSFVLLVWWTDHAERKHYRLVAHRLKLTGVARENWLHKPVRVPPLGLVYPRQGIAVQRGRDFDMRVFCACGEWGKPEALGWMGPSCGPCHDRCEGQPTQEGWPDALVTSSPLYDLVFSPDGSLLATRHDKTMRVWKMATREQLCEIPAPGRWLAFAPSNEFLLVGQHRQADVWNLKTGTMLAPIPYDDGCVGTFVPGRDEFLLTRPQPYRFDLATRTPLREYSAPIVRGSWWMSVAVSPDGKQLAAGSGRGEVAVWELESGRLVTSIASGLSYVHALGFSPDSRTLAIADQASKKPILTWDPVTGNKLGELSAGGSRHGAWSDRLEYSVDGMYLLDPGRESTISRGGTFWHVPSGRTLPALYWIEPTIAAMTLVPGGRHLVTWDYDGVIRFWSMELLRSL